MAHNYEVVNTPRSHLVSIQCDKCGKVVDLDDQLEFQEMVCISFTGGFSSVWGDMTKVSVDLCQDCAHSLVSP